MRNYSQVNEKKKTKKNTVFFFSTHVNIDGFEAKQK